MTQDIPTVKNEKKKKKKERKRKIYYWYNTYVTIY